MSLLACNVKWCAFLLIHPLDLSSESKQQLDYLHMVIKCSKMQGCPQLIAVAIYISSTLDQHLSAFEVSVICSMMQGSSAIRIDVIQVCFTFNNCL